MEKVNKIDKILSNLHGKRIQSPRLESIPVKCSLTNIPACNQALLLIIPFSMLDIAITAAPVGQ